MQDFDEVLQEIGEFGRYQQLVTWLLCASACFMNAYNAFQLVFLMYTPTHWCKIPEKLLNLTDINVTAYKCELRLQYSNGTDISKIPCSSWVYDNQFFDSTIITKWDLICDRAIDSKISLSLISASTVFGCLFYAYVQDHWGRKIAFHINVTTYIVGATVSLFMPNLWAFTAVRLISAVNGVASWNISYIWALKYVGPSRRHTVTTVMCVMYGVGMASLSLIAWLCRTWVQMGLASTLPFLVLLSYHFVIMESPRWLLTQGKLIPFLDYRMNLL